MTYDPFKRGAHPVGVETLEWHDASRDRTLAIEVWYPTTPDFHGQDTHPETCDHFYPEPDPAPDAVKLSQSAVRGAPRLPGNKKLVILTHGYACHRRVATFVGTHLASHGYTVISADHAGCTLWDIQAIMDRAKAEGRKHLRTDHMAQLIEDRRHDIPFMIDRAVEELGIDADEIGVTGSSFGGLTSLLVPNLDKRIRAVAPMCPSGGETPIYPPGHNHARDALNFEWRKDVATMFMVADRDSWLPLYGQIELFSRAQGDKYMFVLREGNHNHFADDIPSAHKFLRDFTRNLAEIEADGGVDWNAVANSIPPYEETCPADLAYECWRGLCVSHFDAYLGHDDRAVELLKSDVVGELAKRDIEIVEISAGRKPD
jgi:dienelactone hydrolase